jgi:hypothetical protein
MINTNVEGEEMLFGGDLVKVASDVKHGVALLIATQERWLPAKQTERSSKEEIVEHLRLVAEGVPLR